MLRVCLDCFEDCNNYFRGRLLAQTGSWFSLILGTAYSTVPVSLILVYVPGTVGWENLYVVWAKKRYVGLSLKERWIPTYHIGFSSRWYWIISHIKWVQRCTSVFFVLCQTLNNIIGCLYYIEMSLFWVEVLLYIHLHVNNLHQLYFIYINTRRVSEERHDW